jgi:hypothetical protein
MFDSNKYAMFLSAKLKLPLNLEGFDMVLIKNNKQFVTVCGGL